jgi:hypothetical protein
VLSVGSCDVEPARNVGTEPCIESVFENDLAELDAAGTLAAAEANEHALITAETRRLHIAAHWADLHSGDATPQSRIPGTQHPARLGGRAPPPSPTSPPPNSAVSCASPMDQRPGSSATPSIYGTGCRGSGQPRKPGRCRPTRPAASLPRPGT